MKGGAVRSRKSSALQAVVHHAVVVLGASALTMLFFLVLPLLQAIAEKPDPDYMLRDADAARLPEDEPELEPEPEEEEEEEEPEEEPPELMEDTAPPSLSDLEVALNPVFTGGWMSGDIALSPGSGAGGGGGIDALFDQAELDRPPRPIYQPSPVLSAKMRERTPATVVVRLIVDERGGVGNARVESSTDPTFDRSALTAVKRWKFEAGRRGGKPVSWPMQVPITFPKGG